MVDSFALGAGGHPDRREETNDQIVHSITTINPPVWYLKVVHTGTFDLGFQMNGNFRMHFYDGPNMIESETNQ